VQAEYPFDRPVAARRAMPRLRGPGLFRRPVVGVAAALFVAVVLVWGVGYVPDLFSDYATNAGEQERVVLADGSRVTLNTKSAIKVDFSDRQRRVELVRGEAYFEVEPDPERPFVVAARGGSTRAVGTAFNVASWGDRTAVTVTEGSVEVELAGLQSVRVGAGSQAHYSAEGLSEVEPADLGALAWQRRQIVFVQQPLSQIIEQVNRYRRGRIIILNAALRARVFTGVLEVVPPDAALESLEKALDLRVTSFTPYLIVLR
jgi:transmembrane sensor